MVSSLAPNLKVLKFHQNLTVDHVISLTDILRKNYCRIVELTLDQCGIEDEGAYELSEMLMVNASLEILNVTGENNAIGSDSVCAIAKALQVNDKLKTLDLSTVQLQDHGACEIGKMLSTNQSLETLCLEHTLVGDEGATALAEGLAANKTLEMLILYYNAEDESPLTNALKVNKISTALSVFFNNQEIEVCEKEL